MKLWLITDSSNQGDQNNLSSALNETFRRFGVDSRIVFCNSKEDFSHELMISKPDIIFSNQYWFCDDAGSPIISHQVFDEFEVPYIGSPAETLELLINKVRLKEVWKQNSVRTPSFLFIDSRLSGLEQIFATCRSLQEYPYIIKPNSAGNSRGIDVDCVVDNFDQLQEVVRRKIQESPDLIVEAYLGDNKYFEEFTIAQIGSEKESIFLPVKIQNNHKRTRKLITTQDKDLHRTETIAVEPGLAQKLKDFASDAFKTAGVLDYGRLDVLSTSEGLFALEINGQPMVPDRWFAGCARAADLDEDQYIAAILYASVMRWNKSKRNSIPIPEQLIKGIPHQVIMQIT